MRWCVFCGSSAGTNPVYLAAATELGTALAQAGIELVYGGGHVGLMGAVADAVLAAGGTAIGVIPKALAAREVAHTGLTKLHVVESMHDRKALMAELSDGFVALPGGFGTFEEFCEAVTWVQLAIHLKPCHLLDVNGYYEPLIALFDRAVDEGFVNVRNRLIIQVNRTIPEFMAAIRGN